MGWVACAVAGLCAVAEVAAARVAAQWGLISPLAVVG